MEMEQNVLLPSFAFRQRSMRGTSDWGCIDNIDFIEIVRYTLGLFLHDNGDLYDYAVERIKHLSTIAEALCTNEDVDVKKVEIMMIVGELFKYNHPNDYGERIVHALREEYLEEVYFNASPEEQKDWNDVFEALILGAGEGSYNPQNINNNYLRILLDAKVLVSLVREVIIQKKLVDKETSIGLMDYIGERIGRAEDYKGNCERFDSLRTYLIQKIEKFVMVI